MKRLFTILGLTTALAAPVVAQTDIQVGTRVTSQYTNSRGFVGLAAPSAQVSANLTIGTDRGSFDIGYWGNFSLRGGSVAGKRLHLGQNTEHDLTFTYTSPLASSKLGTLTGQLGWNHYDVGTMYREVTGALSLDNPLHPRLFFAKDYAAGNGEYLEFRIGTSGKIGAASLDANVAALYNNHYAVQSSGVSGVRTIAGISIPVMGATLRVDGRYFHSTHPDFHSNWSVGLGISATQRILGRKK